MGKYIKYKRVRGEFMLSSDIQEVFDNLITEGWEIIYYKEHANTTTTISYTMVLGKLNEGVEKQIL